MTTFFCFLYSVFEICFQLCENNLYIDCDFYIRNVFIYVKTMSIKSMILMFDAVIYENNIEYNLFFLIAKCITYYTSVILYIFFLFILIYIFVTVYLVTYVTNSALTHNIRDIVKRVLPKVATAGVLQTACLNSLISI